MKNLFLLCVVVVVGTACDSLLLSCKGGVAPSEMKLDISDSDSVYIDSFLVTGMELRSEINMMYLHDHDTTPTDRNTRHYYRNKNEYLWINRLGVDTSAYTLLGFISTVGRLGFSQDAFYASAIRNDLERMRARSFDSDSNTISKVMARTEYHLTKAYLRYVAGQRYGYVSPYVAFNRLDLIDTASSRRHLGFRRLYDANTLRPDSSFIVNALSRIKQRDIDTFLINSQPQSKEYAELEAMLAETTDKDRRRLILCNMEKLRWNAYDPPVSSDGRSVVVNIPSFQLYAYCPDSVMTMRVGCGSRHTKTPLLNSMIERVDFNPQWHIPMSIIRNDVARHAGDREWFDRHNYYIVERSSGKQIDPEYVSADMLLSGKYRVSQRGGEGNSLGKLVFRFPNNFSVYLHDTSTPAFFSRSYRGVSHGCIRVQRPFDLARFMLGGVVDKWEKDTTNVTRSRNVNPRVPIYIIYKTLFKCPDGQWQTYPDVYGYDEIIYRRIKPFLR